MARGNRFSIYDMMEKKGVFEANPANSFSRSPVDGSPLYTGPVEYPKMLYHPQGEEQVTVPGVWEMNKAGREQFLGEQREMIYKIVSNRTEEKAALVAGWHDHPAKAVRARVEAAIAANPELSEVEKAKMLAAIPNLGEADRIRQLESELARLTAQKQQGEADEEAA